MKPSLFKAQLQNIITESKKTVVGSIVLAFFCLYLLDDIQFDNQITLTWFALLLAVTAFRLQFNAKLNKQIKQNESLDKQSILRIYIPMILTVGFLWGGVFFITIANAPPVYDFIVLAIVIGFVASATLSTAPVIALYLSMNLPIMVLTIAALAMNTGKEYNFSIAVALLAFLYILVSAVRYSNYFSEQHKRQFELRETKNEIINALGRAGEYRDEETGNHILRMSHTCFLIAKAIGMSDEEAYNLRNASTMHDVGKIGIPDHILLKPGKLTEEEYDIMKQHTRIGTYILGESDNELLKLSRVITCNHHEKWDGSGYPQGIKGEQIPLEARIAAIADVYDALTSARPYKTAWTNEEAVRYIQSESGKHFDPMLVKVFITVLPKVVYYQHLHHE